MAYPFDVNYYIQSKVAQLKSNGEKDESGNDYTEASLLQVLNNLGLTPQQHYERYGQFEGLNANPYFNENEYLKAKVRQLGVDEDGDAWTVETLSALLKSLNLTPIEHYQRYGAYETDADGNYLNPSNAFDVNAYFSAKLYQVRSSGETVNGRTGAAITMDDLITAMKSSGLSPVAHYMLYGANEVNDDGIALVQTVPMEQRVSNDPGRDDLTGQTVPANYNPATPAPSTITSPAPVALPADIGGYASTDVSPAVVNPPSSLPVPGDNGYVAAPEGWTHTFDSPLIAPATTDTGKATDFWASVDSGDGSALLVKPDGSLAGWLPGGSIDTDADGNLIVPDEQGQTIASGSITATVAPEAVSFTDGTADTYTVSFGSGGTFEVQSVDFTGITLLQDQKLVFESGGDLVQLNSVNFSFTGADLAAYAAAVIPSGWSVQRDGAKLTYTATSTGDQDPISIYYSEPKKEVQSVDVTDVSLDDGHAVYVNGDSIYHNGTGGALTGGALATALAAATLFDWDLSQDGSKVLFTSDDAIDQDLLEITWGETATSHSLEVEEVVKGGPNERTDLTVTKDTPGAAGVPSGSSLEAIDAIIGFKADEDSIKLANAVTELLQAGEVDSLTAAALGALTGSGSGKIGANEAGVFKCADSYYLLINDTSVAFSAAHDIVVKLVGLTDTEAQALTADIFTV